MTCTHAPDVAALMRTAWPRHTAKMASRASGIALGTVKAWVTARFVPRADVLWRMAQENREFRNALMAGLAAMDAAGAGEGSAMGRTTRDPSRVGVAQTRPCPGSKG